MRDSAAIMEMDRFDEFFFPSLYMDCYLRLIDEETLWLDEGLIATHLASCLDLAPFVVIGNHIELPFRHWQLQRLEDVSRDWIEKVIREGQEHERLEIARYREAMKEFDDE